MPLKVAPGEITPVSSILGLPETALVYMNLSGNLFRAYATVSAYEVTSGGFMDVTAMGDGPNRTYARDGRELEIKLTLRVQGGFEDQCANDRVQLQRVRTNRDNYMGRVVVPRDEVFDNTKAQEFLLSQSVLAEFQKMFPNDYIVQTLPEFTVFPEWSNKLANPAAGKPKKAA